MQLPVHGFNKEAGCMRMSMSCQTIYKRDGGVIHVTLGALVQFRGPG